jgi:hypothetical protein
VDETGFKQYNRDGQNPGQMRGWLWVVVTPLVSFFTVVLSRSKVTAQALLGDFTGVVGSDRCPSYNWLKNDHLGSSLDDLLAEEDLLTEVNEIAIKRVIAWQLQKEIEAKQMTKTDGYSISSLTMSIILFDRINSSRQTHDLDL